MTKDGVKKLKEAFERANFDIEDLVDKDSITIEDTFNTVTNTVKKNKQNNKETYVVIYYLGHGVFDQEQHVVLNE